MLTPLTPLPPRRVTPRLPRLPRCPSHPPHGLPPAYPAYPAAPPEGYPSLTPLTPLPLPSAPRGTPRSPAYHIIPLPLKPGYLPLTPLTPMPLDVQIRARAGVWRRCRAVLLRACTGQASRQSIATANLAPCAVYGAAKPNHYLHSQCIRRSAGSASAAATIIICTRPVRASTIACCSACIIAMMLGQ